ncbi:amylo-alpha-1,6-glucosidase [Microbacterium sp. MYb64]|uniref:amylo-alpha-1,6-glucosidase n=1 Tax=Microbacterium sp. MYb64 TaxID=1848691 RepID=UPI000CFB1011|nr:glycogen debranching protein [Microbacterium sp. MYb64]PRB03476.1 glycogen debranching protein [Microbacterium sp. MYb64]
MTDVPIPTAGVASAAELALAAGRHLDLVTAPFTMPRSRLLVFREGEGEGEGVRVHTSEYERRLDQCRVLDALVVHDASGRILPIVDVQPHRISFGAVTLTFDGLRTLSIGGDPAASVRLVLPDGGESRHEVGSGIRIEVAADRTVAVSAQHDGAHDAAEEALETLWEAWFDRCPRVREDLQDMAAFCWWVLGANIVELPSLEGARAIVPSKIGYVGLWQWDAYFIAVGLRHGDPELAREQLELAFRFPRENGQLPDVVHEQGVLATSDDLPESDRATLRRAGSQAADPSAPVPLTKPPLAAWALRKVLEVEDAPEWAATQLERVIRSQDWWFAGPERNGSDLDGDGLPEYGHPYSSGLDDSPVFDGPIPTTAPDLAAYLVQQDREIAALAARYLPGHPVAPHLARAERTTALLMERLWDPAERRFIARGPGAGDEARIASDTVVGLLPLRVEGLPDEARTALREAIDDPQRYALEWGLPTVSAADPDFSPERMWRGPIWINTSALIAEGLDTAGQAERARALREQTVRLVIHGGGPHEYFNPRTGLKAERATTAFAWSAALFIDLAVELSR